ncbi:MAG: homocysteine S-methyltransferase family protein [Clostridiales Family XIII bacterium]|jgi:5-methyltetrahydrofolate--homocysteine methyltransferase|nr:homocysteine S-methyltransferase family protein [Clostridiales Family XIII bacterium]
MGTVLQERGFDAGELPEELNITRPAMIAEIHREYLSAGSDLVTTNTFGANRLKLAGRGYSVREIVAAAVSIAKSETEAAEGAGETGRRRFVALDIGPSGRLMAPIGDMTVEEAYELFREQILAGASAGADVLFFETFTDAFEMKTAVLAAKENCDLPIFCSLSFQEDGRTLMGSDPMTAVCMLQDMGIDAIGANCSLGPRRITPLIREMLAYASIPVLVRPNAGLPRIENGRTVFDVDAGEYADAVGEMLEAGVRIAGGCCGTNPGYIKALNKRLKQINDERPISRLFPPASTLTSACSLTKTVIFDDRIKVVGERLNPTGKKRLTEAIKRGDYSYIEDEALAQVVAGADVLNVNMGLPEIDEREILLESLVRISRVTDAPLQIDCADAGIMEEALRNCRGKPVINSVNGEQRRMDEIFPLVKKYGTAVVALTTDERGVPDSVEERLDILERIISEAKKYGIGKERIIADCLSLTVSARQKDCADTLEAIRLVKERFGVKTTLGVSNISFGLPDRNLLNRTFLTMAFLAGLDLPIMDPLVAGCMEAVYCAEVLLNKDRGAEEYIAWRRNAPETPETSKPAGDAGLEDIIVRGFPDRAAEAARELLARRPPLEIIEGVIVPALEKVGREYERGNIFLPQMIKSADTVKNAFEVLKKAVEERGESVSRGRIILAVVKGDIHDIGSNIVKAVLESYGYEIIDLGKDVPAEKIVETAAAENIRMVGLSALMTTTVVSMEKTIKALRDAGLTCKIVVGGAVLNPAYAKKIGADYYCKDAMEAVRAAALIFKDGGR